MSERLSAELITYSECLEQDLLEDRTVEERAEWTKHRQLVELIVEAIVSTRETLRSEDLSVFEQFADADPDSTESLLDEHYTMAALNDIASVVQRTLRLAQLRASTTPSKQPLRPRSCPRIHPGLAHGFSCNVQSRLGAGTQR